MGTVNQETGLASEFYVLSALVRNSVDANITLGNQKKVDIIVNNKGVAMTIDVKGLKSSGDFIIGNYKENKDDKNHFYIFVYYSDFENITISNRRRLDRDIRFEALLHENISY